MKKNPLNNLNILLKLNMYAKTRKRMPYTKGRGMNVMEILQEEMLLLQDYGSSLSCLTKANMVKVCFFVANPNQQRLKERTGFRR